MQYWVGLTLKAMHVKDAVLDGLNQTEHPTHDMRL